ncbi:aquaporin-4-like [Glandiceps talaboti]
MATTPTTTSPGTRQLLQWKRELKDVEFWKAILSEFLTSFLFSTFVYGSTITWDSQRSPSALHIALVAGFAARTQIYCLLHVGGAHFNPAITSGFFATKEISALRFAVYIGAQCGGTSVGGTVVQLLTPQSVRGTMATFRLGDGVTELQGLGIEFVVTFGLIFVIFATKDNDRSDVLGMGTTASSCVAVVVIPSILSMVSGKVENCLPFIEQVQQHQVSTFYRFIRLLCKL